MPYLRLPNDKYVAVPEGVPYEVALAKAREKFPFLYKDMDRGIVSRTASALGEGFGQLGESASGLGAGIRGLLGDKAGLQSYIKETKEALQEKAKQPGALTLQNLIAQAEVQGLLPALSNVPAYVAEQIAQNAPSMAVPLAAGAGATAAAAPLGPFAPLVGLAAGIGTYGLQTAGQNIQRQATTPGRTAETMDIPAALGAAAVAAPLGFAVDRFIFGLTKVPTKEAFALLQKEIAARGVGKTIGVGALKGLAEVPTELIETALERAQAGLSLTDKDAKQEYLETVGSTLAVGPTLGGAAAYRQRSKAKEAIEEQGVVDAARKRVEARTQELEQERQKQVEQAEYKASPAYSANLFQERYPLVERVKEINNILRVGGKDLDPDDKKALEKERKDAGIRITEINKALKEVGAVPPPAVGKKSAQQIQAELKAQQELVDAEGNILKTPQQVQEEYEANQEEFYRQQEDARKLFESKEKARALEGEYFQPGMFAGTKEDPFVKGQRDLAESIEASRQEQIAKARAAAEKEAKERGLVVDDYGNIVSGKEAQRLGLDIAAAERARQEKFAPSYEAVPEQLEPATAEEVKQYRAEGAAALAPEAKEAQKPKVQQDIDTGYLTPQVQKQLGISLPERKEEGGAKATGPAAALQKATGIAPKPAFKGYDLNQFDQAQAALPAIQERIKQLSAESRDVAQSGEPVENGKITPIGKRLLDIEGKLKDLERLQKIAQDARVKEETVSRTLTEKRVGDLQLETEGILDNVFEAIERLRTGETQNAGAEGQRAVLGTKNVLLDAAKNGLDSVENNLIEQINLKRKAQGYNQLSDKDEKTVRSFAKKAFEKLLSSTAGPLEKNRQMVQRIEKFLEKVKDPVARKALLDAQSLFEQNKTARDKKPNALTLTNAVENILKYSTPVTDDKNRVVDLLVSAKNIVVLREAVAATAAKNVTQGDYTQVLSNLDQRIQAARAAGVATTDPRMQSLLRQYASVAEKQKKERITPGRGVSASERSALVKSLESLVEVNSAPAFLAKRKVKGPFGLTPSPGERVAQVKEQRKRGEEEPTLGPTGKLVEVQEKIKQLVALGAKRADIAGLKEKLGAAFKVSFAQSPQKSKEDVDQTLKALSELEKKLFDQAGAGQLPRLRSYLVGKIDEALGRSDVSADTRKTLEDVKEWFASGRGARGTTESKIGQVRLGSNTQKVAYETTTRGTLDAVNDLLNEMSLGRSGDADLRAVKEALQLEKSVIQENVDQRDLFVAPGGEEKARKTPGQPAIFTSIKRVSAENFQAFQRSLAKRLEGMRAAFAAKTDKTFKKDLERVQKLEREIAALKKVLQKDVPAQILPFVDEMWADFSSVKSSAQSKKMLDIVRQAAKETRFLFGESGILENSAVFLDALQKNVLRGAERSFKEAAPDKDPFANVRQQALQKARALLGESGVLENDPAFLKALKSSLADVDLVKSKSGSLFVDNLNAVKGLEKSLASALESVENLRALHKFYFAIGDTGSSKTSNLSASVGQLKQAINTMAARRVVLEEALRREKLLDARAKEKEAKATAQENLKKKGIVTTVKSTREFSIPERIALIDDELKNLRADLKEAPTDLNRVEIQLLIKNAIKERRNLRLQMERKENTGAAVTKVRADESKVRTPEEIEEQKALALEDKEAEKERKAQIATRGLSYKLRELGKAVNVLTREIDFISRGGIAGYTQALKQTREQFKEAGVDEQSEAFQKALTKNLDKQIASYAQPKKPTPIIKKRLRDQVLKDLRFKFGEAGVDEQSALFKEKLQEAFEKEFAYRKNVNKLAKQGAVKKSLEDKKRISKLKRQRKKLYRNIANLLQRAKQYDYTLSRESFDSLNNTIASIENKLKDKSITPQEEKQLAADRRELQNVLSAYQTGLVVGKAGKVRDVLTPAEKRSRRAARETDVELEEQPSEDLVSDFKNAKLADTDFRTASETDSGVDAKEAASVAARVKESLPKGVDFIYAPTLEQAPAEVRAAMQLQGIERAKGAVLPDGRVVVIGEAHSSIADLQESIAHELIGHYGVDAVLGKDGVQKLADGLFAKGNDHVAQVAAGLRSFDSVEAAMQAVNAATTEDAKLTLVREMIARAAETRRVAPTFAEKVKGFVKDVMLAVRNWFRNAGLSDVAKQDIKSIQSLIKQAQDDLGSGTLKAYEPPSGSVAFRTAFAKASNMLFSRSAKMPEDFKEMQDFADAAIAKSKGIAETLGSRTAKQNSLAFKVSFVDSLAAVEEIADKEAKAGNTKEALGMMYFLQKQMDMLSMASTSAYNGALEFVTDPNGEVRIQSAGGASLRSTDQALKPLLKMGFNPEGAELAFTGYMAALRAEQEGYAKLNYSDEVMAMAKKILPLVKANPEIKAVLDAARTEYNEYNKGLVRFAEKAGAITPEDAKNMLSKNDYIPYYRDVEGILTLFIGENTTVKVGDLKNQPHLQRLVGGDQKIMSYFESSMQNTMLLTDLALRNIATKNTAHAFNSFGLLEKITTKDGRQVAIRTGDGPANVNVLRFKDKGQPKYVVVNTQGTAYEYIPTELLVKGMEGTALVMPEFVKMLSLPARVLRKGITLNPLYPYYQLFKDSKAMGATKGASFSNTANLLNAGKKYLSGDKLINELQAKGVVSQRELFTGTVEDVAKIRNRVIEGDGAWHKFVAGQEARAVRADSAVRAMLYEKYLKEGLSPRDAEYMTIKAMPYNRRGLDATTRYLSSMIPFLNAQIVGLYSLYQSIRGTGPLAGKLNIKKKMFSAGIGMAVGTLIYASMVSGEDWYENMPLETRLRNWLIKLPGLDEPVALPIPFEFGIMFKAFFEATYLGMFNSSPEGKKVRDAFRKLVLSSVPGGTIPLEAVPGIKAVPMPIPTFAQPLLSVAFNKDMYSGNPIEGERELGVEPAERFRDTTSEASKSLGRLLGVSPMQIDFLIRGYTGTVGPAVIAMIDAVTGPAISGAGVKPETKASKLPILGQIFKPADGGALIDLAVDALKEADRTRKTYEKILSEGRTDEAEKYLEKNIDAIERGRLAGELRQSLGEYAKAERAIKALPAAEMTPGEKRVALDELRQNKIQEAKSYMQMFRSGG